jgi:hypothetical protein
MECWRFSLILFLYIINKRENAAEGILGFTVVTEIDDY